MSFIPFRQILCDTKSRVLAFYCLKKPIHLQAVFSPAVMLGSIADYIDLSIEKP
ncbi:hypothetical protein PAMC26577_17970 [Caballeronia sordidicola]|uniref:Uncharacterized protein n=1 Tax=Caballeronia sordidicola TaxID=196367 RepID=A0A242MQT9_CABSO|nr:hypothetical protein PAMC26577_17970 [Caballeronia sordidicola]